MAMMLLSCGLFSDGREVAKGDGETTPAVSVTRTTNVAPLPVVTGTPRSASARLPVAYRGPLSLEERILDSPVIARVRLDSATSTVEYGPTYLGMKYSPLLEFSFSVLEYLKGSGAIEIVAVWAAAPLFDTHQEAEAALPDIAAARDTRWDDHEAIVFLQNSEATLESMQQANRYYLSWGVDWATPDDWYSIASRHNKLWLPAETAVGAPSQPSGDRQRFLLDVPPQTGTAPTITLGELKTRIAEVAAKLNAGDSSEEYRECVQETYWLERRERHLRETQTGRLPTGSDISPPHGHRLESGLAGGAVVYRLAEGADITPEVPFQVWLDDGDASLFSADTPSRDYRVVTTRPLPAGKYSFYFNHRGPFYSLCDGWAVRYEWTVTRHRS